MGRAVFFTVWVMLNYSDSFQILLSERKLKGLASKFFCLKENWRVWRPLSPQLPFVLRWRNVFVKHKIFPDYRNQSYCLIVNNNLGENMFCRSPIVFVREIWICVREMSGKCQGILFFHFCMNPGLIIPRYHVNTSNSLQDIRQNHWTIKYRSQWPTFILRSRIKSYWLIIPRYHVNTSNSLQDIRQNHWTMKYRSQWPTFILRSSIKSYWLIISRYHVNTSNSLQDIRQNHWTIKYRSQWPTFILRSSIKSYWLIIDYSKVSC